MVQDLLSQLGFDEKETTVYLALLGKGQATSAEIAEQTGINRTTVYSVAKALMKRRIISEDLGSPVRRLTAKQPEDLRQLVTREQERLEKKREVVERAVEELSSLAKNASFSIPKITFVPEEDLERYLYKCSPTWSESVMASDGIWWGFQDHTFAERYQQWIDWYWKKSAPSELQVRLLSNQSDIERNMKRRKYERRVVKFWKKNIHFTASLWVSGDYIVMIMTNQHPHYLIEIHDVLLAHNLREMCKGIWKEIE